MVYLLWTKLANWLGFRRLDGSKLGNLGPLPVKGKAGERKSRRTDAEEVALEAGPETTLTKPLTNQSRFLLSTPSSLRMARLDLRQLALPLCRIFLSCFIVDGTGRGKFIAPFPRPHRFDDHP
jgi:hypothetical protein